MVNSVSSVRESFRKCRINTNSVYISSSPFRKRRDIKMKCHDWCVTIIFVIFLCLQLNAVQCSDKGRADPVSDAEDLGRPKYIDGLNIFQLVDPSFKGKYLMKKDVTSFMAVMGKKRGIKISELEVNLFLYSADTDKDGKISPIEYSIIMTKPSSVLPTSFMNLRSESLGDDSLDRDCIYEEDLELLSENPEYDFLLLDTDEDECFSFKEFQAFFTRYGSEDFPEDITNGETSDVASDKNLKNNDKLHLNEPSTAEETKWEDEVHENSIDPMSESEETLKYHMFEGFDRTIEGYLFKMDLPHYLSHKAMLNEGNTVFELEVNLFLYTLDTNKDNKISEMEFLAILIEPLSIVTSSFIKLRSESNSLDKDCIYSEDLELRSDDIENEFQILDVDGDDCLSFSEFKTFFTIFGIQFPSDITADSETSYSSETVDHKSVYDTLEEKNAGKAFYKPSQTMEGGHVKKSKVQEPHRTQSERLSDLLGDDENIFHDFDRTFKGYLTKNEVSSFMLYNGNLPEMQRVSELEVNLFLHTIDTDRDGMISENEYIKANSNIKFNDCISRSFFYFVLNEDVENEIYIQYITKIKSLCLYKSNLKELSEIEEYDFGLLDTDNNGCLTFVEFEAFFVRYGMTSSFQKYLIYGQGSSYGSYDFERFFYIRSPLNYPEIRVSGSYAVQLVQLANILRDIILEDFDLNADGYIDNAEKKEDLTATIFADLDANGDERISSAELSDAATAEFLQMLVLANERLGSLDGLDGHKKEKQIFFPQAFTIFDSDKNGNLNQDEFKFLIEVHRKFIADQIAISKVAQYDLNVDNRISLAEFSHSIQGNIDVEGDEEDEFGNSIVENSIIHNSSHLIEIVFNQMDESADGYVDADEYLIFLRQLYSDAQLKNFFTIADADNDGLVSGNVIHVLLTKVVKPFVKEDDVLNLETFMKIYYDTIMSIVSESDIKEQFAMVDYDKDSVLSADEFEFVEESYEIDDKSDFVFWLDEYLKRNSLEIQENADFTDSFSLFDYNRNGYITKEEFKDALEILTEGPHTAEAINRWFVRLDMNGDNVISMTEFDLILKK